ncbi:MAG: N-acetyltransferase [Lactobacillus sp.]|uniref:N-acetyltransferase n=1 Tax=Bombilactobacillus bombi TaxID=1303590 RepID=A0A3R6ZE50_9LACO|nr:GNAT family N-acetyltransferase [Bombilactobacillus bombi]MCO6543490.1 N-acetyltransferase [Lactobacillus sp.]RHW51864.1 N-acetyltransferase [Bombilactobacillus bombi]
MQLNFEPGRFYHNDAADNLLGEITYTQIDDQTISIDHTFVAPTYRHHGLARQLLQAVLDLAIQNHWKIVPVCPYAKKVFQQEEDIQYLLKNPIQNQEN